MSYPYKTVNKYVCICVYVCAYLPYTWIQSNVLLDGQPFLRWYRSARNGSEEKENKEKLKHDENDDLCIKNGLHSSRSWYELRIFFG
jgi:hypothetical protein